MSPKLLPIVLLGLTASVGCDLLPAGRGSARGDQSTNSNGAPTTVLTRAQHDTFFPISAGAHSAADCNSCHGGFSTFKEFTCISCHEHAKQPTDTFHKGITGYMYESKACLSCHQTGAAGSMPRNDHTARFFPIDPGTSHGNAQCSDCHSNSSDPKQITCISCHEHSQAVLAPKHVGVTGYTYDSNTCLTCHARSVVPERSRADHTFFPIEPGTKHGNTQCSDCHTNANDKSQFTCTSCHDHSMALMNPKHANIADYTYESAACFRCHTDGRAEFNHSSLGTPPNCIKCHQEALAKATTTPASMHVANNFPTTCESCHKSFTSWGPGTTMQHQVVGGTASKCESCHMSALAKANTSPASLHIENKFPTACATCHTSFTAWGPGTKMQHDAVGGMNSKCESCHMADFNRGSPRFNHITEKVSASACKSCHANFTSWKSFKHDNNCFDAARWRGHEGAKCAQCHTVPTDFKKSSCTACHQNRGTNCDD